VSWSSEHALSCQDPLERQIALNRDRWEQKCRSHPELVGRLSGVEQTLTEPDVMTADANFANRECFYRRGVLPEKRREYLKVVVEFDPEERRGRVITAYAVTRLPTPDEEARL
jgi:hypothetical protein